LSPDAIAVRSFFSKVRTDDITAELRALRLML
jgi:hypothetical protein